MIWWLCPRIVNGGVADRQDETLFFSYHLEYGFRIELEAYR